MSRIFVYKQAGDRLDVTTARSGAMSIDGSQRYLRLEDGFRVEGPRETGRDFRLMRYGSNDLLLPENGRSEAAGKEPQAMTTPALLRDPRRAASATPHSRPPTPVRAMAVSCEGRGAWAPPRP